jgi:trimeric autotransporter adhesin
VRQDVESNWYVVASRPAGPRQFPRCATAFTRHGVTLTALASLLVASSPARAQMADPRLWETNGLVYCVALAGNTLYVGGEFTYIGPHTGGFGGLDVVSGALRPGWPPVNGNVNACVPDGSGGWYIGGGFAQVAGVPRSGLAHIRTDGSLDGWNPDVHGSVQAMVLLGSTLYVGGRFDMVSGQPRNFLAALDATTGQVTSWNPGADSYVDALVTSGNRIFVGGQFASVGGQPRRYLAAIDAISGQATPWNPSPDARVEALEITGSSLVAAGAFADIGGQRRTFVGAVDATTGLATPWNPSADSPVFALAVDGNTVFVGGNFLNIGGQARSHLAALDATTAQATDWNPAPDGPVYSLGIHGTEVLIGGSFSRVGGQVRSCLAAVDNATGFATSWNPGADGTVGAIVVGPGTVAVGGSFTSAGGFPRSNIAALDVSTGRATDWDPEADGEVAAIAVGPKVIYAGGWFQQIGGQSRAGIASLAPNTGQATSWNPGENGPVYTLLVDSGRVLVGGQFTSMGGQPRVGIAAVDALTGIATSWAADAGQPTVFSLAVDGATVYVGGGFSSLAGQPRLNLAALDRVSGVITPWNPGAQDPGLPAEVLAVATTGTAVVAGGRFTECGGQARVDIAQVDKVTGLCTAWDAGTYNASEVVRALAWDGSHIWTGGDFGYIGGQYRVGLAQLDPVTGAATAWQAPTNGRVFSIVAHDSSVYVGGLFSTVAGAAASCLARVVPTPTTPPRATVLSPNGGERVVIGSARSLEWDADAEAPGVQSVDLYLSRGGVLGPWELIAAGVPNTGLYNWTATGPAANGTCMLWISARDYVGRLGSDISDAGFTITADPTGVRGMSPAVAFELSPPAPNPARAGTHVTFEIPSRVPVRVSVLDVAGREVAVLADGERAAGRYTVEFDGTRLGAGMYFVRLRAPGAERTRKLVVLR